MTRRRMMDWAGWLLLGVLTLGTFLGWLDCWLILSGHGSITDRIRQWVAADQDAAVMLAFGLGMFAASIGWGFLWHFYGYGEK